MKRGRRSAKASAATRDGADPRFIPLSMRGMMLNGKSFGMSSHGRFILKLTAERAAALVAEGVGKPFSPAPGRVMKGWLEVTDPDADWVGLAKEAWRVAAGGY